MNRPSYEIISATQHWRIINGRIYRDFIARRSDGQLRVVAYPEQDVA
jgi:hypothetical protein